MLNFLCVLVVFLSLDALWLSFFAKNLYIDMLGNVLRMHNGVMHPDWLAACVVYIALLLGIYVFVVPRAKGCFSKAFILGAVFGFVTYATYDFTNLAIIDQWLWSVSVVDTIWGMFLCAVVSCVACYPYPRQESQNKK
jgi:uncharacterized membrane protein